MYRHMLVPLDQSELAPLLTVNAVELARTMGAQITFLTACEDFGATDEGALQRTLSPDRFQDLAVGEARDRLDRAVAVAQEGGVTADSRLWIGDPPHEGIVRVAREGRYDLIVMASHGRRGLERLVLGSQTRKVLDHASTPVLVVPVGKADGIGSREEEA